MKKYFSIILFLFVSLIVKSREGPLTADINNATHAENCEDGSIDLTIEGGFPPYDVIWNCVANPRWKVQCSKRFA